MRNADFRMSCLIAAVLAVICSRDLVGQSLWQSTRGPYADNNYYLGARPNGDLLLWTATPGLINSITLSISTDAGSSWKGILTSDFTTGAMASDSTGRLIVVQRNAIVATTDNGATWLPLGSPGAAPRSLGVNPKGMLFAGAGAAIYISSDSGATWTQAYRDPGSSVNINSFLFLGSGMSYAATTGNGVLRSTDFGLTWNPVPGSSYAKDFNAVALLPDQTLCAGSNGYGLFLSADSGSTWVSSNAGSSDGYVLGLAVDRNGFVYAGTQTSGLYRSTDNGHTWVLKNSGMSGTGVGGVASVRSGNCYAMTSSALFFSTDTGEHWLQRGMLPATITSIGFDGRGNFFAGSNGVLFKSTDGGFLWGATRAQAIPGEIDAIAFDAAGRVFILTSGNILRSTDGGGTWTGILSPQISALATADSGVYAGTDRVLYSGSHGDPLTWRTLGVVGYGYVTSLDIVGHGEILAGTGLGIQRSLDTGATWREVIYSGYPTLSLANTRVGTLLAGTAGTGVLRSSNNGDSWTLSNSGISSSDIQSIVTVPSGDVYALATGPVRVYRSKDDGNSWSDVTAGISANKAFALVRSPLGSLYAGTDKGMFQLVGGVADVAGGSTSPPAAFSLEQNYPNPFNPATTIRFALLRRSDVSIEVFDMLGQRVATLVNGSREAGVYGVQFDGRGLASGAYICVLRAGGFVASKRLLLLR